MPSIMLKTQLELIAQDVRFAWRGLLRHPVFSMTALTAIAVGIGVTAAVFSVIDPVLFRPLPYTDEDRLVSTGMLGPAHIDTQEFIFGRTYLTLAKLQTSFEQMTSWSGTVDCDLNENNPLRLSCGQVESNFLSTLGVRPLLGRDFDPEDDQPNAPRVVLISFGLWRGRFGADRGIVNRTIFLNDAPVRIVGVLPATFELPTLARADVLVPQQLDKDVQATAETGRLLWAFARLKPGISLERAQAEWELLLSRALDEHLPQAAGLAKPRVRLLRDRQTHDALLGAWVLFGAVLAVLAIACTNVATLLLARASGQQQERAIRTALGAGRWRWWCQSLSESLLLGIGGAVAGCMLAYILVRVAVGVAPQGVLRLGDARLDGRVLILTVAVSIFASLFFAMVRAVRVPQPEWLAGQRVMGPRRHRLSKFLVAGQIAMSLMLLTGATLLFQTFWNLQNIPLGMRTNGLLTAGLTLSRQRYPQAAAQGAFFNEVAERLRLIPGVTTVAIADSLPPNPARSRPMYAVEVNGSKLTGADQVVWRAVSPEYFQILQIRILRGRAFSEAARDSDTLIINETLARRLFPNQEPLAGRVDGRSVIGIAADARNGELADAVRPEYYVTRPGGGFQIGTFVIDGILDAEILATQVRSAIASVDPTQPVILGTLEERASRLLDRSRFHALLLFLFASFGLTLSAIGLYGLSAFLVIERTREIGVRMALGAMRRDVIAFVISHTARWSAAGATAGLAGSVYLAGYLQGLLFNVRPGDPWSLGIATSVLLLVALVAALLPARRATHIDPVIALKHE
jgi:putative ABC transport system permease protein